MRGGLVPVALGLGLLGAWSPDGPVTPAPAGGVPNVVPASGSVVARAHAEMPPPGHTGGFGEPTCQTCHAEFPLNEPGGVLRLEGLPRAYHPGREYPLTVVLEVPETIRAGFQLSSRTAAGDQAGTWGLPSPSVSVVDSAGVSYAFGTEVAGKPESPDRAVWTVHWTAPRSGLVHFHLAANSANGDDSPFGDLVYATEIILAEVR